MAEVIERRADITEVTPMMQQYLVVKEQYSDFLLLYRLGDFYECFFDDALVVSRELELTLTSRDCGHGKRAAMCGVPFHKADVHIGRLVERGYRVAVCEQVENPKEAQGLVKREVTRVVTPGTLTDSTHLSEGKNNYLCALCFGNMCAGVAFADISTGEVYATFVSGNDYIFALENELAAFSPAEMILNIDPEECRHTRDFAREKLGTLVNTGTARFFAYEAAARRVREVYSDEADTITEPELSMAVGALLLYIRETQKTDITYVNHINLYSKEQFLELDMNTRRNLELTETMRAKEKRGTLLWVLDKTETAMGQRMLRSFLQRPLLNPTEIGKRQSAVRALVANQRISDELGELLSDMLDLERLTARAVYGTANAKDLRAIYQSVKSLDRLRECALMLDSDYLRRIFTELDTLSDIADLFGRAIVDDPPHTVREGGMIREGYSADVDYYRSVKSQGREIMQSIEEREREATGIRTLKVDYNKVFGYYIEVSKSFVNDVPPRFVRKQTLTNCERYITQEIKEMEDAIFNADDRLATLEFDIFTALREVVTESSERIRRTASLIAELDVYRSFAIVASKNGYVCPEVDFSNEIYIKDGRHPVVEKFVSGSYFVPNDTTLDTEHNRMMIITGPNMAGKSTYMRQVAIISIMAQIGSFVPAREARLGIVDKVFTRVGASDDLASGQSTFMLEMSEVAYILKNATRRSLIIYDEVGRGTSTYDGMAIARAVVEYTASKKIGAKTLFATHYHELTDMEGEYDGIVNYSIAAKKRGGEVIFLRKILRGGADESYGVEVAKLAGVPNEVVRRAREILESLEAGGVKPAARSTAQKEAECDLFTSIIDTKNADAAEKIRSTDINTITPIEAMNLLFELKRMLNE